MQHHAFGPVPLRERRLPWSELLRRVFAIEAFRCDRCGGPMGLRSRRPTHPGMMAATADGAGAPGEPGRAPRREDPMRRAGTVRVSNGSRFANGAALALGLVLASGCALFGGPESEPHFATIAVVTQGQSDVDLEADSTTKSALVGGGAGVLGGAVVGAGVGAAAGIGGGPLAPLTMVLGAGVGGALGAATGGTAGVIIGGLQGLPSEKAKQVTGILAALPETRDFQEELRSAVESSLPEDRRAPPERAEATAIVQLTELELEQHLSDKISLRLRAKMTVEWGPNPRDPESRSYHYEWETPERHVDEWLRDDGADFGASFTEGIDTIAGQMTGNLLWPKPR
jgi:hypothetical protein